MSQRPTLEAIEKYIAGRICELSTQGAPDPHVAFELRCRLEEMQMLSAWIEVEQVRGDVTTFIDDRGGIEL